MRNTTNAQLLDLRSRLVVEKAAAEQRLASREHYGLDASLRDESGDLSATITIPPMQPPKRTSAAKTSRFTSRKAASEPHRRGAGRDGRRQLRKLLDVQRTDPRRPSAGPSGYALLRRNIRPAGNLRASSHRRGIPAAAVRPHEHGRPRRRVQRLRRRGRLADRRELGQFRLAGHVRKSRFASYDDIGIEQDETDGYVETFESFVATDITGNHRYVVRNDAYDKYLAQDEGEPLLEKD